MFDSIGQQTRDWLASFGAGGESALPAILMAAGMLLLTVWAMGSLRRRLRKRAERSPPAPADARSRVRQTSVANAARREIDGLMVDAEELTRRLAATLDSKAARVEALLDRAEARLAEMEERWARADAGARDAAHPAHSRRRASPVRAVSVPVADMGAGGGDPLRDEVVRLADEGLPPVEIARRLNEQIGKVELILALREA